MTMTVQEIMSVPVVTCTQNTWLADAARLMQSSNRGIVAVVEWDDRIAGVMTDRDICLAIAASNRSPRAIRVHEVMSRNVVTVGPDDDVLTALQAMKRGRVRRLPVLDASRRVIGLVSLADVATHGVSGGGIAAEAIVGALRALHERRRTVNSAVA
jgi:CBS-domain-containing membrane protein